MAGLIILLILIGAIIIFVCYLSWFFGKLLTLQWDMERRLAEKEQASGIQEAMMSLVERDYV